MKIIYLDGNNIVVVNPVSDWEEAIGAGFIARKDVPKGISYKIIDDSTSIPLTVDEYSLIQGELGEGDDFGCGSDWAVFGYELDHNNKVNAKLFNSITNEEKTILDIKG